MRASQFTAARYQPLGQSALIDRDRKLPAPIQQNKMCTLQEGFCWLLITYDFGRLLKVFYYIHHPSRASWKSTRRASCCLYPLLSDCIFWARQSVFDRSHQALKARSLVRWLRLGRKAFFGNLLYVVMEVPRLDLEDKCTYYFGDSTQPAPTHHHRSSS